MRLVVLRAILLALSPVIASQAHAMGCDTKEYAQYKDKVRDRGGRQSLALQYCLNNDLMAIRPGTSESDNCRREMAKILDALDSAKATGAINYAIKGCKGQAPK